MVVESVETAKPSSLPMKQRNRRWFFWSLFVAAAIYGCWYWYKWTELRTVNELIEQQFSHQILLLEKTAIELDKSDGKIEWIRWVDNEDQINQLETTFHSNAVFHASWSQDGHHGMRSLKAWPRGETGYQSGNDGFFGWLLPQFRRRDGARLSFGKTFNVGTRLIVLDGRLSARSMRHYHIAYRADAFSQKQ